MYQISDYRAHQHYGPLIAERVWTAWWQASGFPLSNVVEHMEEMANSRPLPTALVAHDADGYAGSALIIDCDLDERPQAAAKTAGTFGYKTTYLCCHREVETYYASNGWTVIEQGVGDHDLTVMTYELAKS